MSKLKPKSELGGVVMVTFVPEFVLCTGATPDLSMVVDHMEYIISGKCPSWKPDCNPNNRYLALLSHSRSFVPQTVRTYHIFIRLDLTNGSTLHPFIIALTLF